MSCPKELEKPSDEIFVTTRNFAESSLTLNGFCSGKTWHLLKASTLFNITLQKLKIQQLLKFKSSFTVWKLTISCMMPSIAKLFINHADEKKKPFILLNPTRIQIHHLIILRINFPRKIKPFPILNLIGEHGCILCFSTVTLKESEAWCSFVKCQVNLAS